MRKICSVISFIATGVLFLTSCGTNSSNSGNASTTSTGNLVGVVKTGGSTSVEKVINTLIYQFKAENQSVEVNYESNGSGDGIVNTLSGLYEIGHSSRELKKDGTEDGLEAIPYAVDGIVLATHKDNTAVETLTQQQVKDIYTGKIKNWKELNGMDAPITVVTREEGSGTRGAFSEILGLEKKEDDSTKIVMNATVADSTGAVQTQISQNKNSIGYLSYSELKEDIVRPVRYENIEANEVTLKNGNYQLKRDFYLLTKKDTPLSEAAQAFMDYVMSDAGQNIVAKTKLVPKK